MHRLYTVKMGFFEIKGLVSPREVPNAVSVFYSLSKQKGASAEFKGNGIFVAQKDAIQIMLIVGEYHDQMPSKMLQDVLNEVIEMFFS